MITPGESTAHTSGKHIDAERQQYYAELENLQMGPLWAVLRRTLTREPPQRETPHLWRWFEPSPVWAATTTVAQLTCS